MNAIALAFSIGLTQGLLHGLGPDHCAAMATLGTATKGRYAALNTALRFALGHAVVLGTLAALCLSAGLVISETFEKRAEVMGGAVLVAIGFAAFFFPGVLAHGHAHLPGHSNGHAHRGPRLTAATGALLAVSGGRSLLMALAPLLVTGGLSAQGLAYLPGFAFGILVSMGALGLLLSLGVARLGEASFRIVHRCTAVGTGALGLFWMAQNF